MSEIEQAVLRRFHEAELQRLEFGPSAQETTRFGLGLTRLRILCDGDAPVVFERIRDILRIVLHQVGELGRNWSAWEAILPEWFLAAHISRDASVAQGNLWFRGLTPAERIREGYYREWTLDSWLYWFQPSEKEGMWTWWSGRAFDDSVISLEFEGSPYPLGIIIWLSRVAGATEIQNADGETLWKG